MPRKKKTKNPDDAIYAALFTLIAKEGWWGVTLPKLARASKIKLSDLLKEYPEKTALLVGFLAHIDRQLAESDVEDGSNLKERLFEVLMRRFELLLPYRPGLSRLMDEALRYPFSGLALALEMAPAARRSLRLVLTLAEFSGKAPCEEAALVGLKLLHLQTLRIWKSDSSADLSATMAELDRNLDRFISFLRLA
jgi:hypothetical protein